MFIGFSLGIVLKDLQWFMLEYKENPISLGFFQNYVCNFDRKDFLTTYNMNLVH